MNKTLQYILITLAIILPLGGVALIVWGMSIWDKINFKPYFVSADFKGLNLKDVKDILVSGVEKEITAVLGIEVTNDSDTAITFSGLKAKIFYEGTLIAETTNVLKKREYTAEAHNLNNPLQVVETVLIRLNQAGARLLIEKLLGRKAEINYELQLSVFKIPYFQYFPIKSSFEW